MDINSLIAQMAGGGGNAPAQMAAAQAPQQGLTPSQAQPLDDNNAAALLEQLLSQIGPAPAGPQGPRSQDPYFAAAMDEFVKQYGHEPASDGEFAEVEKIAVGLMQDGERASDMDEDD